MNCKRYFTGALAAFMVARSAFMAYAEGPVANGADPAGLTSAPGTGNETAGVAAAETTAPASAAETQGSTSQIVTVGENTSAGTVNAGEGEVLAGNTITAGDWPDQQQSVLQEPSQWEAA